MPDPHFRSVSDVLASAIQREIEAADSYGRMAGMTTTPGLRQFLMELKGEEENHRRLLEGLAVERLAEPAAPAADMGLSDALEDIAPAPDMTFQELLIFAARKEKTAEDLYAGLARRPELAAHIKMFEFLAGQERTHKIKLEAEYETYVLSDD
jgi:rubrerythrin